MASPVPSVGADEELVLAALKASESSSMYSFVAKVPKQSRNALSETQQDAAVSTALQIDRSRLMWYKVSPATSPEHLTVQAMPTGLHECGHAGFARFSQSDLDRAVDEGIFRTARTDIYLSPTQKRVPDDSFTPFDIFCSVDQAIPAFIVEVGMSQDQTSLVAQEYLTGPLADKVISTLSAQSSSLVSKIHAVLAKFIEALPKDVVDEQPTITSVLHTNQKRAADTTR